ncbi:MAG: hypothetical protein H6619_03040 [Deltaproteobacteria bacterium]|nr:hypothetical protein [Deltaproteobacteria bacterium]
MKYLRPILIYASVLGSSILAIKSYQELMEVGILSHKPLTTALMALLFFGVFWLLLGKWIPKNCFGIGYDPSNGGFIKWCVRGRGMSIFEMSCWIKLVKVQQRCPFYISYIDKVGTEHTRRVVLEGDLNEHGATQLYYHRSLERFVPTLALALSKHFEGMSESDVSTKINACINLDELGVPNGEKPSLLKFFETCELKLY